MTEDRRARLRRRLGSVGAWVSVLGAASAREALPVARRLEEIGYPALWIAEGHGTKEVMTHSATLLAATERIVVGAGVASIYARDPMAAVNGARTLADAYGDRFVLGLGVSHRPLIEQRGHPQTPPLETMRSYLDAIAATPFRIADAVDPAIVLGGLRPRMTALAAQRTEGVHSYLVTADHTRATREAIGPAPVLVTDQPFVLAGAGQAAEGLAAARRYLKLYLTLPNYCASLLAMGFTEADLENGGSDQLVTSIVAIGTPAEVATRIAGHHAAGADHVGAHPIATDTAAALVDLEALAATGVLSP